MRWRSWGLGKPDRAVERRPNLALQFSHQIYFLPKPGGFNSIISFFKFASINLQKLNNHINTIKWQGYLHSISEYPEMSLNHITWNNLVEGEGRRMNKFPDVNLTHNAL